MLSVDYLYSPMLWGTANAVIVFLLCVLCAGVIIPQILLISYRRKLFDMPDERKIHRGVVPRLGGIAFKPVVFFSVALLLGINKLLGQTDMLRSVYADTHTLCFGFCSVMLLYLVGMADDLIGIRYRPKFVVQIICGIMMIGGGLWIGNLHGLFGIYACRHLQDSA